MSVEASDVVTVPMPSWIRPRWGRLRREVGREMARSASKPTLIQVTAGRSSQTCRSRRRWELADPQRRGRVGLAAEFCAAIADDELRVIEVTPHDYRRMAELLTTYSSLRLQVVDACVIALAERLDLHEVATLDRRDFQIVAPRHLPKGERSKLLPED
jgi:predicted nucleic acid-binding protein